MALAPADGERSPFRVEVGQLQATQLETPQTGGVKEFEHGPVPDAQRIGDIGDAHEGIDLGERQGRGGQPLFHARQVQFAGGIVEDNILACEPREPVLEDAESAPLGAPSQAPAAGSGVTPEPALVGVKDWPGNLGDLGQIPFSGPGEEVPEGVVAAFPRHRIH